MPANQPAFDRAYLIPVGPLCDKYFVSDTLESVLHYESRSAVVVVDDSHLGTMDRVMKLSKSCKENQGRIHVITTPHVMGKGAGLWYSLCLGLIHIRSHSEPGVVIRMDTDALVTGRDFSWDALTYFRHNPEAGIIGSHWISSTGERRDTTATGKVVRKIFSPTYICSRPKRFIRNPLWLKGWVIFRNLIRLARANGYVWGEHCMGGACCISGTLVNKLIDLNLLARPELLWVPLEEDSIFAILSYACGFKLSDFATDGKPMGLKWKGLPMLPSDLIHKGKKVIHSTRFFGDMKEKEIREYFVSIRNCENDRGVYHANS